MILVDRILSIFALAQSAPASSPGLCAAAKMAAIRSFIFIIEAYVVKEYDNQER